MNSSIFQVSYIFVYSINVFCIRRYYACTLVSGEDKFNSPLMFFADELYIPLTCGTFLCHNFLILTISSSDISRYCSHCYGPADANMALLWRYRSNGFQYVIKLAHERLVLDFSRARWNHPAILYLEFFGLPSSPQPVVVCESR